SRSGVTRTVVPSGRSTGSNNSILPSRTTARTVLSIAHASDRVVIGFGQLYYAVKCAAVQYLVLPPAYVILAGGLLYDQDWAFSSAPLAPNARVEPPRPGGHPQATKLPLARSAPVRCSARSMVYR